MGLVADHRVEDHEQLPHAGGQHDFERLASPLQAVGEPADDRVAAAGRQGRHVRHASHRGAAAPDGAFALEPAAVMVVGRQAHQRADLLPVELSEFGKFGQEKSVVKPFGCGCAALGIPWSSHTAIRPGDFRYSITIARSAGVMPLIRPACAMSRGLTRFSFSFASIRNCGTAR